MMYTGEQNLFNQLQKLYQTQMWALEQTIKPWEKVKINLVFSLWSSYFLQPLSPRASQQLSEEKQVSNGGYFTSTEPVEDTVTPGNRDWCYSHYKHKKMALECNQLRRSQCMTPTSVLCHAGSTPPVSTGNAPVHFVTLRGQYFPLC